MDRHPPLLQRPSYRGSALRRAMYALGTLWARAITAKAQGQAYRVTIFVDGLTRHEQATFTTSLRARGIARKKVRGVRDEHSNAGIRLADALCGLIRDAEEGEPWAVAVFKRLRQRGVVTLV